MKKNAAIIYWIKQSLYYIWIHTEMERQINYIIFLTILLNTSFLFSVFLNLEKNIIFYILLLNHMASYLIILFYGKNKIKHNIAKSKYKIFLNEVNQEFHFCPENLEYFLLYKKIEFDKLNNLFSNISNSVLQKFKKKFRYNTLYTTKSNLNLYDRMLIIKSFNKLKKNYIRAIFDRKKNIVSLGPFHGGRRKFFKFQNIKINNNSIEIKVEV
jgi:hypothetical protein